MLMLIVVPVIVTQVSFCILYIRTVFLSFGTRIIASVKTSLYGRISKLMTRWSDAVNDDHIIELATMQLNV